MPSFDIDSKVPLDAVPALLGWPFCLVMLHAYPVRDVRLFFLRLGSSRLCKVKFNVGSEVKQNSNI